MGTKAYIIIKVEDKDLNRKIQFDPSKMPWPVQVHPNQEGKPLPEVEITGKYLACHNLLDSYPDYLGVELLKNYNTYEKVLNLCAGGIYDTIVGIITLDGKTLPADQHCIKNSLSCSGYEWDLNKPEIFKDFTSLEEAISHSVLQYAYLFEDGKWSCKHIIRKLWKPLLEKEVKVLENPREKPVSEKEYIVAEEYLNGETGDVDDSTILFSTFDETEANEYAEKHEIHDHRLTQVAVWEMEDGFCRDSWIIKKNFEDK